MTSGLDCRVYVGNLPPDVREKDVKALFWKYGSIKHVTLKNHRGPSFGFVEFDDYRDAQDAVKGRSGYNYDGYKLRVEQPKTSPGDNHLQNNFAHISGGTLRNAPSKRTQHRVIVSGLPVSGSWQDLKDHMREAGDVCYADVHRNGCGIVEFLHEEDARYAIRHLDDTKFRSHEEDCILIWDGAMSTLCIKQDTQGETSYVRVEAAKKSSRSRSRSPRRSPTYSASN